METSPFGGINFSFNIRVDDIYRQNEIRKKIEHKKMLLSKLKQLGGKSVFIGIESLSDQQLLRYSKGIKVIEVKKAIKILKKLGFVIVAGFLPFDTSTTPHEIIKNMKVLKNSNIINYVSNPVAEFRLQAGCPYVKRLLEEGVKLKRQCNLVYYERVNLGKKSN